jgi:hypothetical protein
MSPHQSRHSRGPGKAVESARPADDKTPMGKFSNLARALLNVSNAQVKDEQRRYNEKKG